MKYKGLYRKGEGCMDQVTPTLIRRTRHHRTRAKAIEVQGDKRTRAKAIEVQGDKRTRAMNTPFR